MAITTQKRARGGQLWARVGPVFASPARNFRPFFYVVVVVASLILTDALWAASFKTLVER